MFLDASAVVAILAQESDWSMLLKKVEAQHHRLVSPLSIYESSLGIMRKQACEFDAARVIIQQFLQVSGASVIAIDEAIGNEALSAFKRFGKGRHKAALNMGDCFSYACAKVHKVPLLYKGDDFIHTDIRSA